MCSLMAARCLSRLISHATFYGSQLSSRAVTAAVAAVLKSIYAHNKDSILQFQSTSLKERQIDFSNKSLIKTHLQLLVTIVDEYASAFWASAFLEAGSSFWLYALSRDRDSLVRAAAIHLISSLLADCADQDGPTVRDKLIEAWPEAKETIVHAALAEAECEEVRAAGFQGIRKVFVRELEATSSPGSRESTSSADRRISMGMFHLFQSQVARYTGGKSVPEYIVHLLGNQCSRVSSNELSDARASPLLSAVATTLLDLLRLGVLDIESLDLDHTATTLTRVAILGSQTVPEKHSPIRAQWRAPTAGAALERVDKGAVDAFGAVASATAAIDFIVSNSKVDCMQNSRTIVERHSIAENVLQKLAQALSSVLVSCTSKICDGKASKASASVEFGRMIRSVATCFNTLLTADGDTASSVISRVPCATIVRALQRVLSGVSGPNWAVHVPCCRLLATLLSFDQVTAIADVKTKGINGTLRWDGPKVCRKLVLVLIRLYADAHKPAGGTVRARSEADAASLLRRATVGSALKNLLAASAAAKAAYVAGGHVHSTLRTIRDGANLAVAEEVARARPRTGLDATRGSDGGRRADDEGRAARRSAWIHEIVAATSLLKSLLVGAPGEVRLECHESGALNVLRDLWPLALTEHGLMHELLGALVNIMHREPAIKAAVVGEDREHAARPSIGQLVNDLASRTAVESQTFSLALRCMQQLASSTHSLASLIKMSFLGAGACSRILPAAAKKRDVAKQAAIFRLLATMAAQPDGPKHLLFDKGMRPALDETLRQACGASVRAGESSSRLQHEALTVWHNLSFSSEAKAFFSVNDCLGSLLEVVDIGSPAALDGGREASVVLVLKILWALAHRSQKISLQLKKVGAQSHLQALIEAGAPGDSDAADQNRPPSPTVGDLSLSLMNVLRV